VQFGFTPHLNSTKEKTNMKLRMICTAVSAILLAAAAASAQTDAINFNTTYQTIRGFGTSTAWQPVLNSTQANNLFGVGAGQVGFTILRSRIDPSSTTGGSNWATERSNAQQAQSINSQVIVFATPWTPPAVWKSNGSVDDGTLNTADYDNFANYLNAFIAYETAGGVNLYAISVQNEPNFLPSYESCGYSGAQMDAWIAQEGGKINTKLMMPEADSFNTDMSDPTLNDSNAVGHVAIVAGHTYGVAPFYYTNAKNKGKDVWMTETTYTPAAGSSAQPTISDAIAAAELYHQSMAVAQYNAYVYWWTPLLLNGNSPNYYAYALGQYSKFVRPGYVMNGANNNPTSGVYVTSYSGSGKYVIVAVNANGGASNITFDISGATITSVTPYQTSASNQIAQLSAVGVSGNAFTYSLPGQSITTFVGTGTSGTPSFTLSDSASSLSVTQGSTATDTITVTPENGFTGSVTFTATGMPSGVTASWSPTSSTTSSVLTLTASSTATTGGPVTVTVTGTSGSTTASTTVALTVNASSCTSTAIVPYISVSGTWTAESSATVTSTSTAVNLGPQPTSGGSWAWTGPNGFTSTAREIDNIALSTGANVYTATYTNSCGAKSTQVFTVTVTGSTTGFSLSSSASSLSVKQGASGTETITVTDTGGFTGSVAFTTSALPSGVTAAFSPTSSATSSVLTLTASSTAAAGAYTITVTGTSGSTTATTSFILNVSTNSSGGCAVTYTISPQNSSNFGASITIVNGGSTTLSNWVLTWSFANGQTISSSWNGTAAQSGANVTVSEQAGQSWENIPAGGSYSGFGFNGTWNGTTNAIPTAFSLNGTACTVN
jgi:glucuronoarabinoxylan endo-1,4-beta-xylanase